MSTEQARIGTAIVAYIEPHAGLAREFNRWYELDHFYSAAMAGPGACAGARWVAPRALKDARPPGTLFGDPRRGSYLATYWILPGMQAEWDAWTGEHLPELVAAGRMFAGRDHVHTALYRPAWDTRADGAPPPIVALDHGFAGIVAVAARAADAAALERAAGECVDAAMPLAIGFAPVREILSESHPEAYVLALMFCEADPLACFEARVLPALDAAGIEAGFASPFVRTVPGTDRYVDEL